MFSTSAFSTPNSGQEQFTRTAASRGVHHGWIGFQPQATFPFVKNAKRCQAGIQCRTIRRPEPLTAGKRARFEMMRPKLIRFLMGAAVVALLFVAQSNGDGQAAPSTTRKAQPPRTVRLYVFDCGVLHNPDMARFNLEN